jgi:hypothetical protein
MTGGSLYTFIAGLQGETPFGRVLDAGTGLRSLRWLRSLATESITAVTAASANSALVQRLGGQQQRAQDRLLVGNWTDPELLAGERFDTVLADYLLGAVEGFAPYFQEDLFRRLRPLTAGRLYLTGVEPYVVTRPMTEAGALIWQIGRFRDACLLLCDGQPYREYPLDWVLARLRQASFRPTAARKFPVAYKDSFVNGEIDLCRPRLDRFADQPLTRALVEHGEALRARARAFIAANGALNDGFAYVVAADPA